jgi:hypothetical protein
MPSPFHWSASLRLNALDRRRCLWEFDAHRLMRGASTFWLFACPIWCLLLPCLVLPVTWLRKRPRPDSRGFAVVGTRITQKEIGPQMNADERR